MRALAHRPGDRRGAHGRTAAALMGIRVDRIYAITFGIGALMAGAAGAIFAMVYPVTTNLAGTYLGKAFVICVIGGLGSVPGALGRRSRARRHRELLPASSSGRSMRSRSASC